MPIPLPDTTAALATVGKTSDLDPAQFLAEYGQAAPFVRTADAAGKIKIPPDDDRCLLSIWGLSNTAILIPDAVDDGSMLGPTFAAGGNPLILTFATHQQIVTLGFTLRMVAGDKATIIVARQKPSLATRKRIPICRPGRWR